MVFKASLLGTSDARGRRMNLTLAQDQPIKKVMRQASTFTPMDFIAVIRFKVAAERCASAAAHDTRPAGRNKITTKTSYRAVRCKRLFGFVRRFGNLLTIIGLDLINVET
jgi:hypothetical protein